MELDMRDMRTGIGTEETLRPVKPMEQECTNGSAERSMMETGSKDKNAAMVSGKERMVKFTLENGRTLKPMVLESIHGQTEINMKGNGKTF